MSFFRLFSKNWLSFAISELCGTKSGKSSYQQQKLAFWVAVVCLMCATVNFLRNAKSNMLLERFVVNCVSLTIRWHQKKFEKLDRVCCQSQARQNINKSKKKLFFVERQINTTIRNDYFQVAEVSEPFRSDFVLPSLKVASPAMTKMTEPRKKSYVPLMMQRFVVLGASISRFRDIWRRRRGHFVL